MRNYFTATAAGLLWMGSVAFTPASATVAFFETFSYTGDITVYDTLADAQAASNARSGPHAIPTATNGPRSTLPGARDGSLYVDTSTGELYFLTAWYMTSPDQVSFGTDGYGNPNNTNTGFFQLYDGDGSSVSAMSAAWNVGFDQFTIAVDGAGAGASEFARMWHAPELGGAAGLTAGSFVEYSLVFNADYAAPQPANTSTAPSNVHGSFTGIFENTNVLDPALNGFYAFDFAFQRDSWAENVGAVALYDGSRGVISAINVPATSTLPLAGLGLLLAVAARRRA